MDSLYFQHLCADNDHNGNPRRLFVLVVDGERVAAWDEGYSGSDAVPGVWRDKAYHADRLPITVTLYKELRKALPSPAFADEVPGIVFNPFRSKLMPNLTEPVCIVDGHHGIYVPAVWAERYGHYHETCKVSQEDVAILLQGPDHADYWEAWQEVLNDYCHEVNNIKHYLSQDGDLFEYPETYEWED